jgi:large subunit ribosomal protein L5
MKTDNLMRQIRVEKLTLNIGTKGDPEHLKKGVSLLTAISHRKVVETKAKKRLAAWKLRPGLPIGAKVTLRGEYAEKIFKNLLVAIEKKISKKSFNPGNFSFGVKEYIDIPEVKYDPKIGIIGLEASVTLERPGFRIKKRRLSNKRLPLKHQITTEDTIKFVQEAFGVEVI